MAYYILGPSVTCYCLLMWGTKNARETTYCLAYTALQPVASVLLTLILLAFGVGKGDLNEPGWNGLGGLGVLVGVGLVTLDAYLAQHDMGHLRGSFRASVLSAHDSFVSGGDESNPPLRDRTVR